MPAASGSSAPTPARRPGSSSRSSSPRRRDALARPPAGRGQRRRIRWTCSAARPPATYADASRACSPTRGSTRSSCCSSPTVAASAEEVARRSRPRWRASRDGKPVLAVVMSADGIPAAVPGAQPARRRISRIRSRRPGRSGGRPSAPTGCVDRRRGAVELEGIDHAAAERIVERALAEREERLARRRRRRGSFCSHTGSRSSRSESRQTRTRQSRRPSSSAARSSSRPRRPARTRRRPAASRSTSGTRSPCARRSSGSARRCSSSRWSKGGAELLAGVVQDPVFGPLVAFGPGRRPRRADRRGRAFGSRRSRTSDAEELVTGGKAGRLVAASAAHRRRTSPRSPISSCGSRASATTFPSRRARSESRTRARRTAAWPSTRASACIAPRSPVAPRAGSCCGAMQATEQGSRPRTGFPAPESVRARTIPASARSTIGL